MASRRLAIASLLCDDDSKIGQGQGSSSSSPHYEPHPPSSYSHPLVHTQSSTSPTSPTMSYTHIPPSQAEHQTHDYAQVIREDYNRRSQSPTYPQMSRSESPGSSSSVPANYVHQTAASPSPSPTGSPPLRSTYEPNNFDDDENWSHHSRTVSVERMHLPPHYQHTQVSPLLSSERSRLREPAEDGLIAQESRQYVKPRSPIYDSYRRPTHSPLLHSSTSALPAYSGNSVPTPPSPTATFQTRRHLVIQTERNILRSTHQDRDELGHQRSPSYYTGVANVSPALSTGPLSGLDALVEAAAVERERIDEHRRLSGGSTGLPVSLTRSPVLLRERHLEDPHHSPSLSPQRRPQQQWGEQWGTGVERDNAFTRSPVIELETQPQEDPRWNNNRPQYSPVQAAFIERSLPSVVHSPTIQTSHMEQPSRVSVTHFSRNPSRDEDTVYRTARSTDDVQIPHASSHHSKGKVQPGSHRNLPLEQPGSPQARLLAKDLDGQPHTSDVPPPGPIVQSSTGRSISTVGARRLKPGSAALAAAKRDAEAANTLRSISLELNHTTPNPRSEHGHSSIITPLAPPSVPGRGVAPRPKASSRNKKTAGDIDDFFLSTATSPRNNYTQSNLPGSSMSRVSHPTHQHETTLPSRRLSTGDDFQTESDSDVPGLASEDVWDDQGFASTRGEDDTDVDGALVDAIGYPTSEDAADAGRDFAMDVDDELLSLIDGPDHHQRHQANQAGEKNMLSRDGPVLRTQKELSAPPPPEAQLPHKKKKDVDKVKGKSKAVPQERKLEAVKLKKSTSSLKGQEGEAKVSTDKSKTKTVTSKASSSKLSKPNQTMISPSPVQGTPAPDNMSVDNVLPNVTSSGRIVTKSKKSAAAALAAQTTKKKSSHQLKEQSDTQSRSQSVVPSVSGEPDTRGKSVERRADANEVNKPEDDSKLYCICRTTYNENRVMIACDKCDEWYHTQCVKMSDLEVDLVDQFFCPLCIAKNPTLSLQTTYKARCFAGLKHPKPHTASACHKPSRGALSKYCSDECGVKYLRSKIEGWSKQGGNVHQLWESVKGAKKREGVVKHEAGKTLARKLGALADNTRMNEDSNTTTGSLQPPNQRVLVSDLRVLLDSIANERESRKKELDFIQQREQLLHLAIDRAKAVGECGWDQRLCFDEEEWAEFGEGILESYVDDSKPGEEPEETHDDAVWWCRGGTKCDRHAGWQKLRVTELNFERQGKETQLTNLTSKEREIRKRIEDILCPQNSTLNADSLSTKLTINKSLTNGVSGTKGSDGGPKKAKKKHN